MSQEPEIDARARILDAAEQAFAEGGLAGARVAAIVEAAGVNKATLYYYFDSKQALYEAVVARVFDQLLALAEAVPRASAANEAEALVDFVEGYGAVVAEHPNVLRVLMRGLLDAPDDVVGVIAPRVGRVLPLLAEHVARGQAAGHLNPDLLPPLVPPTLVAPMVMLTIAGHVLQSITGIPADQLRTLWMRNLRAQSLRGLLARSPEES